MKTSFFALTMFSILSFTACEKAELAISEKDSMHTLRAGLPEQAERKIFELNTATSVVEWKGAGPGTIHIGTFSVESQDIEVVNGKIKEGKFVIPIASITNFDLPDHLKPVLLDHLKSADFFDMISYPEATFEFKKVTPLTKPVAGSVTDANYMVTGDFTMLGKALSISFPAKIKADDNNLTAEAILKLDRTKWGMNYGADPALGDHHIYPEVDLHLKLNGQKQ